MPELGLDILDRTVHETNTWLQEVQDAINYPDRQMAYHALRGVLFTLRDRLVLEEAVHLAMQLPVLIRGVYFEGYQPGSKPETFGRDEFVARVAHELDQAGGADPEAAVRGVFEVLDRHISEGEAQQVVDMLPDDMKTFWPE